MQSGSDFQPDSLPKVHLSMKQLLLLLCSGRVCGWLLDREFQSVCPVGLLLEHQRVWREASDTVGQNSEAPQNIWQDVPPFCSSYPLSHPSDPLAQHQVVPFNLSIGPGIVGTYAPYNDPLSHAVGFKIPPKFGPTVHSYPEWHPKHTGDVGVEEGGGCEGLHVRHGDGHHKLGPTTHCHQNG